MTKARLRFRSRAFPWQFHGQNSRICQVCMNKLQSAGRNGRKCYAKTVDGNRRSMGCEYVVTGFPDASACPCSRSLSRFPWRVWLSDRLWRRRDDAMVLPRGGRGRDMANHAAEVFLGSKFAQFPEPIRLQRSAGGVFGYFRAKAVQNDAVGLDVGKASPIPSRRSVEAFSLIDAPDRPVSFRGAAAKITVEIFPG
jgi:hypothetical protein